MGLPNNDMAYFFLSLSVNCPAWLIRSFNSRISSAVFNMLLIYKDANYELAVCKSFADICQAS